MDRKRCFCCQLAGSNDISRAARTKSTKRMRFLRLSARPQQTNALPADRSLVDSLARSRVKSLPKQTDPCFALDLAVKSSTCKSNSTDALPFFRVPLRVSLDCVCFALWSNTFHSCQSILKQSHTRQTSDAWSAPRHANQSHKLSNRPIGRCHVNQLATYGQTETDRVLRVLHSGS
jgi:hypothetical protein